MKRTRQYGFGITVDLSIIHCSAHHDVSKGGDRERVRGMVERGDFIEIFCGSSIKTRENRDTKGLYKTSQQQVSMGCPKSRTGQMPDSLASHRLMKPLKAQNLRWARIAPVGISSERATLH